MWYKVSLFSLAFFILSSFYSLYNAYSHEKNKSLSYSNRLSSLNVAYETLQSDMVKLQKMDDRYLQEISNAQNKISVLERNIRDNKYRLHLSATCGKQQYPSPTSMDDEATARLTDSAERDYFDLRRGIAESSIQIKALQEYILTQCVKSSISIRN